MLDFLDCLEYLEHVLEHDGIVEFMRNQYEDDLKNDSCFELYLNSDGYNQYSSKDEVQLNKYLKLIKDTWDIKTNSILMWVCW